MDTLLKLSRCRGQLSHLTAFNDMLPDLLLHALLVLLPSKWLTSC